MQNAVILGTGSYLPEKLLTNDDLAKIVDTSHDWIVQRSGIHARHIAADNQSTSDMAVEAAKKALGAAEINAGDLGGIIVATTTPDLTFPSTAAIIQAKLGIETQCMAFDVQAVCSGFIYALATANGFFKSGQTKPILVIGAEKMSALLDWTDRTTCVLFGDGAAAVVLGASDDKTRGILSVHLHADGRHCDLLKTNGGPSTTGDKGVLTMEGREVFKFAVEAMSSVVRESLADNNIDTGDIDWLVPHQANIRIIEGTAKKLSMPMERVVLTLANHGNTSAASIPLALDAAVRDGRIRRGHTILLEAMGGGFTWGAALVRY